MPPIFKRPGKSTKQVWKFGKGVVEELGPEVGLHRAIMILVSQTRAVCVLGIGLFLATFGLKGLLISLLSTIMFIAGGVVVLLVNGWERSEELLKEFDSLNARTSPGIPRLLKQPEKKSKKQQQAERLTGSALLDPVLEEIVSFALRDFVESWYSSITNDEELLDSLRGSIYRTILIFSSRLRRVDWVPLVTQHIVDDFASHIRLYRKAKDKVELLQREGKSVEEGELESQFFDLELDMEKSYCRDLVSTSRQYENAYLHDVADVLMYLLIPPEDFRSRPFRFLLREVLVRRILMPFMDQLSDPDYINHTINWLLSEVPLNSEDFLGILEASDSLEELAAVRETINQEINNQRAQDTGHNDTVIKQQLSSLYFVRKVVDVQTRRLNNGEDPHLGSLDESRMPSEASKLFELPLSFVLANNISVSFFMDYLSSVGGTAYIDLFLAIEGFKVSAEHQLCSGHLNRVTKGVPMDPEILDTIREAAHSLYKQYLSDQAKDRVELDQSLLKNLRQKIKSEEPSDSWFDEVQHKVFQILKDDVRYYPGFRRNPLYFQMLADLALINRTTVAQLEEFEPAQCEDDLVSLKSTGSSGSGEGTENVKIRNDEQPIMLAHITTIGIGREGNHAFALYNIQVTKQNDSGETTGTWNVMRRYSDFHTLHATIEQKFNHLAGLSFPGKKTFNNLNQEFLEKRKKALNTYLRTLLYPEILRKNPGLEDIVRNFLCKKEYVPEKGIITKKVMSLVNPIQKGVKAFGYAVTAVPDTLVDGVSKMGDGIGKVTKSVLGEEAEASSLFQTRFLSAFLPYRWLENPLLTPLMDMAVSRSVSAQNLYDTALMTVSGTGLVRPDPIMSPEGRVGAGIGTEGTSDNIPLRIMLLLMDEVFGLRQRNQWFRRRLVAFLRQLIHAAFGSSINRKIVDFVAWMTSEEQVAEYLRSFRNSFWPNGVLADPTPTRPHNVQMRSRVVVKVKMLAALPDELRLFMGNETSRRGIHLVFEALQNSHLNRRLCYVLLERLLVTVFPDNRFESILPKGLHTN